MHRKRTSISLHRNESYTKKDEQEKIDFFNVKSKEVLK